MGKIEDAVANMIANMKANTGKSLEEWLKITAKAKLTKHGEIVKMLKADHGLGHGFANLVANRTLSGGAAPIEGDDLLAAQYAGPKAELKPLYDKLAKLIDVGKTPHPGRGANFTDPKEIITIDGLRVEYADGFGLARSSNTTPVIVLRFEADNAAALQRIQDDFRRVIMRAKPDAKLPF